EIPAEHVRSGRRIQLQWRALDLRVDEAAAADEVRSHALAIGPADRHADDDVPHQVQHAVVPEDRLVAEETRVPSEVHFAAHDAGPHPAGGHAVRTAAVVDVAAKGR